MQLILTWLTRIPILALNGTLYLLYAFAAHLTLWIILASGLAMLLIFDRAVIRLISSAPSRIGGRPAPSAASGTGIQLQTLLILGLSIIVGMVYAEPVPFLLAAMWVASDLAVVLFPNERDKVLNRAKTALTTYTLLLLGFRILMIQMQNVAPEDWAVMLGSVGAARESIAKTRDLFTTIGMLATWLTVPAAYFGYLVQLWGLNPPSFFHARRSTEEIIAALRRRS